MRTGLLPLALALLAPPAAQGQSPLLFTCIGNSNTSPEAVSVLNRKSWCDLLQEKTSRRVFWNAAVGGMGWREWHPNTALLQFLGIPHRYWLRNVAANPPRALFSMVGGVDALRENDESFVRRATELGIQDALFRGVERVFLMELPPLSYSAFADRQVYIDAFNDSYRDLAQTWAPHVVFVPTGPFESGDFLPDQFHLGEPGMAKLVDAAWGAARRWMREDRRSAWRARREAAGDERRERRESGGEDDDSARGRRRGR